MKKSTQERADASQKFWKMLAAQLEAAEQKRRAAATPKRSGYHRDRLLDLVALHLPIKGDVNESAVRKMLNGFGVQAFEIRVVDNTPGTQNKAQVRQYQGESLVELKNLKWLRKMNGLGRDIYIRPARPEASGIVLVDDLNQAQLNDLNALGLKPALVLETSPGNHQAWIRINSTGFSPIEHKAILGFITDTIGGDKASIDQQHFGRLPGFTNRKAMHVQADGKYPFVKLHSYGGERAPGGEDLLEKVRQDLSRQAELDREARLLIDAESAVKRQSNLPLGVDLSKPLPAGFLAEKWHAIEQDFVRKGQVPDLSAIDFGAAMALGSRNVPIGEALRIFEAELPHAGRKGLHLDDYILRTVSKAYARVELSREGFAGGKTDLMAEAHKRFPHLFDEPLKKRTIAPALKTSNAIFAQMKAKEFEKSLAQLQEKIDGEDVKNPGD